MIDDSCRRLSRLEARVPRMAPMEAAAALGVVWFAAGERKRAGRATPGDAFSDLHATLNETLKDRLRLSDTYYLRQATIGQRFAEAIVEDEHLHRDFSRWQLLGREKRRAALQHAGGLLAILESTLDVTVPLPHVDWFHASHEREATYRYHAGTETAGPRIELLADSYAGLGATPRAALRALAWAQSGIAEELYALHGDDADAEKLRAMLLEGPQTPEPGHSAIIRAAHDARTYFLEAFDVCLSSHRMFAVDRQTPPLGQWALLAFMAASAAIPLLMPSKPANKPAP